MKYTCAGLARYDKCGEARGRLYAQDGQLGLVLARGEGFEAPAEERAPGTPSPGHGTMALSDADRADLALVVDNDGTQIWIAQQNDGPRQIAR